MRKTLSNDDYLHPNRLPRKFPVESAAIILASLGPGVDGIPYRSSKQTGVIADEHDDGTALDVRFSAGTGTAFRGSDLMIAKLYSKGIQHMRTAK